MEAQMRWSQIALAASASLSRQAVETLRVESRGFRDCTIAMLAIECAKRHPCFGTNASRLAESSTISEAFPSGTPTSSQTVEANAPSVTQTETQVLYCFASPLLRFVLCVCVFLSFFDSFSLSPVSFVFCICPSFSKNVITFLAMLLPSTIRSASVV